MAKQGLMSSIVSSDLAAFGIFQGEFETHDKIRKSAFQDEFLGKNKNVRPLTTLKICCTEFTPSETRFATANLYVSAAATYISRPRKSQKI